MGFDLDSAPTLEALLLALQTPVRRVPVAPFTVAAATDYTAGDAISGIATDTFGLPQQLLGCARYKGVPATLRTVRGRCDEDAVLGSIRFHFFNQLPIPAEVEMDDNVAFDLKTTAGLYKWVGSVLLNPFVDRGTAGSTSDTPNLQEDFDCGPGQDLWMLPVWETGETNETAGMRFSFDTFWL